MDFCQFKQLSNRIDRLPELYLSSEIGRLRRVLDIVDPSHESHEDSYSPNLDLCAQEATALDTNAPDDYARPPVIAVSFGLA
jgi:hypothetical protein